MKACVAYNACIGSLTYRFPGLKVASSYPGLVYIDVVDKSDLIILTGGEDINPSIYNEKNLHCHGVNPYRDSLEIRVLNLALELGKHVLGICRGHQLINAYLGGVLAQDLYMNLGMDHNYQHELKILEDGIISKFFPEVNSMHHQGVTVPGVNLTPTSFYNGVYESCESEKILTVQFHPEFMDGENVDNFFNYITEWSQNA